MKQLNKEVGEKKIKPRYLYSKKRRQVLDIETGTWTYDLKRFKSWIVKLVNEK